MTSLQNRVEKVRAWWNDDAALANVIAQGKFLKLCAVTTSLEEIADVSVTDDCDCLGKSSPNADKSRRRGRPPGVEREPN